MDFELTSEQVMLKETVSKFVDRQVIPKAPEVDQDGTFPKDNFAAMAELGLFGISIPPEYGGIGADLMSSVLVMEQLSRGCASTANTYGSHAILCTENIFRNGNEAQKKKYLPDLIAGKKIGFIAITEPEAGSDAISMRTRAVKKGDKYVLNGTKMFITNGGIADLVFVAARTDPTAKGSRGISIFAVEKDTPGFKASRALEKMGCH